MSQAEELLNSLTTDEIATYTANGSDEPHIVIGSDRIITVPDELKRIAVQFDHNIETVVFDCPRYWDEHDMSEMAVYINYKDPNEEKGYYQATDVTVDDTDSNIMHFSWTISKHLTLAPGPITFLVCVKKTDNTGEEVNHWNSELNKDMYVSEGLEIDETVLPDNITPQEETIEITKNGSIDITPDIGCAFTKVTANVNVPTATSAAPDPNKLVRFYDYDGTLLYSYDYDDVLSMLGYDTFELPELPSHEGLICQGWNYSKDDILNTMVDLSSGWSKSNRPVNIGATYVTDDGKTRLYINIASDARMDVPLYYAYYESEGSGVTIDWGDGTIETITDTGQVSRTHSYSSPGEYVITLDSSEVIYLGDDSNDCGVLGKWGENVGTIYTEMLRKVELGENVINLGAPTFIHSGIEYITIPKNVTAIMTNCFYWSNIKFVVIPSGVTQIPIELFCGCNSLQNVSMPYSVAFIGSNAFQGCTALNNIAIPDKVSIIQQLAFHGCKALESIVIPPKITAINTNTFYECASLEHVELPDTLTVIGTSAFEGCSSLRSIALPIGLTTIAARAFYTCRSLACVFIPPGVTEFENSNTFLCVGMKYFDFRYHTSVPSTPPTMGGAAIASDCEIRVPSALHDEWIVASGWSSLVDHIVAV